MHNELWEALFESANKNKIPETELTLFLGAVGKDFDGCMMVVGRSVNGLVSRFRAEQLNPLDFQAIIDEERARLSHEVCNMAWVQHHWHNKAGYNTAKSAFWRVTRAVAARLGVDGTSWSSQLAWSNLYRVSPFKGGNPSAALCAAQLPACRALLKDEITQLEPRLVLFLTGEDWLSPFTSELGLELHSINRDGVDAVGKLGQSVVVVCKHPQGKAEAPMINLILELFEKYC